MLVVVLNMPEHSSFQDMLFPMLFISKYAKSNASIMDISLLCTAGRPGSSEIPRNPLTRWDVSLTPANGIFLT